MAPPDINTPLASRSSRTTSTTNPTTRSQNASPENSRRTSTVMGPPPVPNTNSPLSSPRPPQATTISPTLERQPSEQGPIRHPRPLTAAELHLELEKEQESIVNRLTRELSALRAQTASVASTTSSTSDLFTTSTQNLPDPYSNLPLSSSYGGVSIIPTSARRHRSSSNLSTRSARSARDALARDNTTSISGVAAPRETDRSHGTSARQSLDINREGGNSGRPEGSRQNSYSLSHRDSQGHSYGHGLATSTSGGSMGPGVGMYRSPSQTMFSYGATTGASPGYMHRTSSASQNHSRNHSTSLSLPTSHSQSNVAGGTEGGGRSPSTSFGSAQATARYEEAAIQRMELETVRRENEALRQRVRELERLVSAAGAGPAQVNGSGTASGNGSVGGQTLVGM